MAQHPIKYLVSACTVVLMVVMLGTSFHNPSGVVSSNQGNSGKTIAATSLGPQMKEDHPLEQARKNIQVLKGVPESQLFPTMNFMCSALGVNCAHCHVATGNEFEWDKDDKSAKKTARQMIQMVFDINEKNFKGRTEVTCYTCHRGQADPISVVQLPVPKTTPEEEETEHAIDTTITVDSVLNRYVTALGGKSAIEKCSTRVLKGSVIMADGPGMPLEIYEKAPDKYVETVTRPNQGTSSQGFDGTTGWAPGRKGYRQITGADLDQLKLDADFYRDIKFKELYANLRFRGKEKVGNRETYLLVATAGHDKFERFYFDIQSGLLVRTLLLTQIKLGRIPQQTDYEDYQVVDGIDIPMTVHHSSIDARNESTYKFTEVRHNVAVGDEKFMMPSESH